MRDAPHVLVGTVYGGNMANKNRESQHFNPRRYNEIKNKLVTWEDWKEEFLYDGSYDDAIDYTIAKSMLRTMYLTSKI